MRSRWVVSGLAVLAVALAGLAAYRYLGWAPASAASADLARGALRSRVDLGKPDAVIRSASLARLPRDVLRLPLARDVLTEDFVFYYEQHEDRLALRGALRRIAYEHQLDWGDRVIEAALDAPAEIGLWRDGKGALRRFAVVLQRNLLVKLLQDVAVVAMKDRQLRRAGEISVDGYAAPVYALALSPRRTLLVVANGERIVLLSDPGLLLDEGGNVIAAAQQAVAAWLTQPGMLGRSFQLDVAGKAPQHTLALGARTLTLGYASLMPVFKGLRFDYATDAGWSTQVWYGPGAGAAKSDAQIWRGAPANPSVCAALPLDWKAVAAIVGNAQKKPALADAAQLAALQGPAFACWYRESNLYAPLIALRVAGPAKDRDALVRALAAWALRPVDAAGGKTAPAVLARGEFVFFSPDPALVKLALDTLERRNPSVADQAPDAAGTLALLMPRSLAPMFEREALAALEREGNAGLRSVARTRLAPRMSALAKYPSYRLMYGGGAQAEGWQKLEWRAVGAKP